MTWLKAADVDELINFGKRKSQRVASVNVESHPRCYRGYAGRGEYAGGGSEWGCRGWSRRPRRRGLAVFPPKYLFESEIENETQGKT